MQRSILITGITSGIGNEVFKICQDKGFLITGVIRQESQRDLFKDSPDVGIHIADLSQKEQVLRLANNIQSKKFDYVLLNAGCVDVGVFHDLPLSSIDKVMETNLLSNMRLVHQLLPSILEHKTKIAFVSSMAANRISAIYTSYAVSKAGLSYFYQCLKKEYPNLPLLCLEIGTVYTPLHAKAGYTLPQKKHYKTKETVAELLLDAVLTKTGFQTLSVDWQWLKVKALISGAWSKF